jgi:hypothetical protein
VLEIDDMGHGGKVRKCTEQKRSSERTKRASGQTKANQKPTTARQKTPLLSGNGKPDLQTKRVRALTSLRHESSRSQLLVNDTGHARP